MVCFEGYFSAIPTPFDFATKSVDLNALSSFLQWQIASGISGIVCTGTTGEICTLSESEYRSVVAFSVEVVAGRCPVVVGVGFNDTRKTLEAARYAEHIGAHALLAVTPYYNRPSRAGLLHHFRSLAESVSLPIMLYNIPGRTGLSLPIDLIVELAESHSNIVAIKESSLCLENVLEVRLATRGKVAVLCGEDANVAAFFANGAIGCVSVTSNVVPDMCVALYNAWKSRREEIWSDIRDRLVPLHKAMFIESNPGPVKYALSLLNKMSAEVRAPLVMPSDSSRFIIYQAMRDAGRIE